MPWMTSQNSSSTMIIVTIIAKIIANAITHKINP
jgi:hypothetical protein